FVKELWDKVKKMGSAAWSAAKGAFA
uniref:M-poneritoxin-Nc2a n=1 Tax=Neoponera commutata TaxID=613619 RepID=LTX2A_NEOCU|nr:RecName: Full=M-poneritoxin-Nc2a; Short=M-PONTX-Nc2a; AltName: Full=Poneratoxin; AltName: Full=Ponericin Nc2a [Pachycondyla commutata]